MKKKIEKTKQIKNKFDWFGLVWFSLVWFYGISPIFVYFIPNQYLNI